MKKLRKVYLAIPYSKWDVNLSFKVANEMTVILLNKGYNVFSPITHSHSLTKLKKYTVPHTWDYWRLIDYQFIQWADELIVVVPDANMDLVKASTGVMAEIKYAKRKKIPVSYIHFDSKKMKEVEQTLKGESNKVSDRIDAIMKWDEDFKKVGRNADGTPRKPYYGSGNPECRHVM